MFVSREKIELNQVQTKLVISGWGKDIYESTVVEKITYLSDGLKVKGYLSYPLKKGKYPCIIWNRGGYLDKGAIDRFNARGIFGQIASWGYVVFASQYRGNSMGEGKEEVGGSDVNDILNLIPLADEIPEADKSLWGIEGWSRGGMMTYLALMRSNKFKCAVLVGAISDFKSYVESGSNVNSVYKKILGEEDYDLKVNQRTIISSIEKLPRIPYLLIHGGKDETVPVNQTRYISEKFREAGIDYRLFIPEEGDHYLKKYRKEVDELKKEWYSRWLK